MRAIVPALLMLALLPACQCNDRTVIADGPAPDDQHAPTDAGPEFLPTLPCLEAGIPRGTDAAAPLPVKPGVKWTLTLAKGSGLLTSPVLGVDGELVVSNSHSGVLGISVEGKPLWSIGWPGDISLYGWDDPTTLASRVAFSSDDGRVLLVWPKGVTGDTKALDGPFASQDQMTRPIRLGPDRFMVGASDGKLYDFTAGKTGARRIPISGGYPDEIVADGQGVVYLHLFGSSEVLAVDLASGGVLWRRTLGGESVYGLALDGQGSLLAAVSHGGTSYNTYKTDIVALDRACGATRWRFTTKGMLGYGILLVDADGDIVYHMTFYGKAPGALERLSPEGVRRWRVEIDDNSYYLELATLGPIGADGTIFAYINNQASDEPYGMEPRLRAYSRAGQKLWEVPLPHSHVSLGDAPLLLDDGTLILGVSHAVPNERQLVAFQTRSPGLAAAPWPHRWHDNHATSNLAGPTP